MNPEQKKAAYFNFAGLLFFLAGAGVLIAIAFWIHFWIGIGGIALLLCRLSWACFELAGEAQKK